MVIGNLDTRQYSGSTPNTLFGDQLAKFDLSQQERARAKATEDARLKQQEFTNRRASASDKLAQQQASRQEDIYKQGIKREDATNAGIFASTNPTGYTASKMAGEQQSIQQALAQLDPATRAATEQAIKVNYNPQVSGQQWLGSALSDPNADQSKLFSAKKNQYDLNLATVGTPEHQAALKEKKDIFNYEQGIRNANALNIANIGATNAQSKVSQKEAEDRLGLAALYNQYNLKPNVNMTNKQQQAELDRKIKAIDVVKEADKELSASGNFLDKKGATKSDQQTGYLADLLEGSGVSKGSLFSPRHDTFAEEVKDNKPSLDRLLIEAKRKLGKSYSDKDVLMLVAEARKNQVSTSPNDTLFQDALEDVADQLDLLKTDF